MIDCKHTSLLMTEHEQVMDRISQQGREYLLEEIRKLKADIADLKEQGRTITLSGCDIKEADLIWGAMHNLHGNRRNTLPRWALVRDAFGCGSGVATALCRRFGLDPDEIMK